MDGGGLMRRDRWVAPRVASQNLHYVNSGVRATLGPMPWLVVVGLLLIPVAVAGFFGMASFRKLTPLVFRCRRCGRYFFRAAHRAFPARCARCGAADWNC
jgi:hypothetical protein